MFGGVDPNIDEAEEITRDKGKQALTNAEASYLMHQSFKKKMDMMEKEGKPVHIQPVFLDFLDYLQKFPHLGFSDDAQGNDLENLNEVIKKTRKVRQEVEKFKDITDLERTQLCNLCPGSVEEAIAWISSLERFQIGSKEVYLRSVLEIITKHTPANPRA